MAYRIKPYSPVLPERKSILDPLREVGEDIGEAYTQEAQQIFGEYADIPTGFLRGASMDILPAVAPPRDASGLRRGVSTAAYLGGMAVPAGWIGRGLRSIPAMGRLAAKGGILPAVGTAGATGGVYGAGTGAVHQIDPLGGARPAEVDAGILRNAANYAGIFGAFGGAGRALEPVLARAIPSATSGLRKLKQIRGIQPGETIPAELQLTSGETSAMKVLESLNAPILGAGAGTLEPAETLEERLQNAIAGSVGFAGAHAVGKVPGMFRGRGAQRPSVQEVTGRIPFEEDVAGVMPRGVQEITGRAPRADVEARLWDRFLKGDQEALAGIAAERGLGSVTPDLINESIDLTQRATAEGVRPPVEESFLWNKFIMGDQGALGQIARVRGLPGVTPDLRQEAVNVMTATRRPSTAARGNLRSETDLWDRFTRGDAGALADVARSRGLSGITPELRQEAVARMSPAVEEQAPFRGPATQGELNQRLLDEFFRDMELEQRAFDEMQRTALIGQALTGRREALPETRRAGLITREPRERLTTERELPLQTPLFEQFRRMPQEGRRPAEEPAPETEAPFGEQLRMFDTLGRAKRQPRPRLQEPEQIRIQGFPREPRLQAPLAKRSALMFEKGLPRETERPFGEPSPREQGRLEKSQMEFFDKLGRIKRQPGSKRLEPRVEEPAREQRQQFGLQPPPVSIEGPMTRKPLGEVDPRMESLRQETEQNISRLMQTLESVDTGIERMNPTDRKLLNDARSTYQRVKSQQPDAPEKEIAARATESFSEAKDISPEKAQRLISSVAKSDIKSEITQLRRKGLSSQEVIQAIAQRTPEILNKLEAHGAIPKGQVPRLQGFGEDVLLRDRQRLQRMAKAPRSMGDEGIKHSAEAYKQQLQRMEEGTPEYNKVLRQYNDVMDSLQKRGALGPEPFVRTPAGEAGAQSPVRWEESPLGRYLKAKQKARQEPASAGESALARMELKPPRPKHFETEEALVNHVREMFGTEAEPMVEYARGVFRGKDYNPNDLGLTEAEAVRVREWALDTQMRQEAEEVLTKAERGQSVENPGLLAKVSMPAETLRNPSMTDIRAVEELILESTGVSREGIPQGLVRAEMIEAFEGTRPPQSESREIEAEKARVWEEYKENLIKKGADLETESAYGYTPVEPGKFNEQAFRSILKGERSGVALETALEQLGTKAYMDGKTEMSSWKKEVLKGVPESRRKQLGERLKEVGYTGLNDALESTHPATRVMLKSPTEYEFTPQPKDATEKAMPNVVKALRKSNSLGVTQNTFQPFMALTERIIRDYELETNETIPYDEFEAKFLETVNQHIKKSRNKTPINEIPTGIREGTKHASLKQVYESAQKQFSIAAPRNEELLRDSSYFDQFKEIEPALKKLLGDRFNLEIVDRLENATEAYKQHGLEADAVGVRIAGEVRVMKEKDIKALIRLASADTPEMQRTAFHEAAHVLEHLMTPVEQDAVMSRYVNAKKSVQEAFADDFADYMTNRGNYETPARRFFEKVKSFLEGLKQLVLYGSYTSPMGIYRRMAEGDFVNRTLDSEFEITERAFSVMKQDPEFKDRWSRTVDDIKGFVDKYATRMPTEDMHPAMEYLKTSAFNAEDTPQTKSIYEASSKAYNESAKLRTQLAMEMKSFLQGIDRPENANLKKAAVFYDANGMRGIQHMKDNFSLSDAQVDTLFKAKRAMEKPPELMLHAAVEKKLFKYRARPWMELYLNDYLFGDHRATLDTWAKRMVDEGKLTEVDVAEVKEVDADPFMFVESPSVKKVERMPQEQAEKVTEESASYEPLLDNFGEPVRQETHIRESIKNTRRLARSQFYLPRMRGGGKFYVEVVRRDNDTGKTETLWRQDTKRSNLRTKEEVELRQIQNRAQKHAEDYQRRLEQEGQSDRYTVEVTEPKESFEKSSSFRGVITEEAVQDFASRTLEGMRQREPGQEVFNQEMLDTFSQRMMQEIHNDILARGAATRHKIRRKRLTPVLEGESPAVQGYETENLAKVYTDYVEAAANSIKRTRFMTRAYNSLADIPITEPRRKQYWQKYIEGMLAPQTAMDRGVGMARNLMFVSFLGYSPRAAAVQTTQNLTTMGVFARVLHSELGTSRLSLAPEARMAKAATDVLKKIHGDPKAETLDTSKLKGEQVGEAEMLRELEQDHTLEAQYVEQVLTDTLGASASTWKRLVKSSAFFFSAAERFNRRTAALARYRVSREAGKDHKQAVDDARQLVRHTHYDMGKQNLPNWALGGTGASALGKLFYTYKTFPHNYISMQLHYMRNEQGKLEFDVMLRNLAYLSLLGGITAPFVGSVLDIGERITGKPFRAEIANSLGGMDSPLADGVLRGLPAAALGVDMSGSMAFNLPDVSSKQKLVDFFGGAFAGEVQRVERGITAAEAGDVKRAGVELLPSGLGGPLRAYQGAEEGIIKGSGHPLKDPQTRRKITLTPMETVFQTFGFTPSRVSSAREMERISSNVQARYQKRRNDIYKKYRDALVSKDHSKLRDLQREIREYNDSVAHFEGTVPQIDKTSLKRAATEREDKLAGFLSRMR